MLLRAYLELLRPANVVTALADVLAGFAIARRQHGEALPWLLTSTACLYAGGVVLNDVFDRRIDAIERPERPLPSGRVKTSSAAIGGVVLLIAGVVLAGGSGAASMGVAAAIAALVLLYDAVTKPHGVAGPATVAACRALNLALGMSADPTALSSHWPIALLPFVYITAVTVVSRGEVHGGRQRQAQFSLAAIVAVVAALATLEIAAAARASTPVVSAAAALAFAALLAARVIPPFWRAAQVPAAAAARAAVRAGVLALVVLDASLGAAFGGPLLGLLIFAISIVAGGLARLFAVT